MSKIFFGFVLACTLTHGAYAHGVGYRRAPFEAVALEFFYSTGEKMSYCEARVFSPNDEKFAAQTGRTDEAGRFAFVPDTAGKWRVIVRDNEGHQCEAEINFSQEFFSGIQENFSPTENNLYVNALLGVSIIFNLAMIIRMRQKKNAHQ